MLSPAPAMDSSNPVGRVHSLETFGLVDGPGVRFVVFLQGCRMRCQYCHNPETWNPELGEVWTPEALFQRIYRYKGYWGKTGGLTVSGGEPLLQIPFLTELFRLAKAKGVHTALDTSGQSFRTDPAWLTQLDGLLQYTDLVLLDLKEMDEAKHRSLTGHSNQPVLALAKYLSDRGISMWIRHVLVPGLTDDAAGLTALRQFVQSLATVERVEVLPYHTLALAKWQALGIPYPLDGVPTPTKDEVHRAEDLLGIPHSN